MGRAEENILCPLLICIRATGEIYQQMLTGARRVSSSADCRLCLTVPTHAEEDLSHGFSHLHDLIHTVQFIGRRVLFQNFQNRIHFSFGKGDVFLAADLDNRPKKRKHGALLPREGVRK